MSEDSGEYRCRNCGVALKGSYCHQCGQSSAIVRRPSKELLDDLLGNFLQWDSRLFKTLRLLVLRPGHLSGEWVEGRRARYVPPFRLYIIVSFILFLLVGILAGGALSPEETVKLDEQSSNSLRESIDAAYSEGDWLTASFLEAAEGAIKDPLRYWQRIISHLPKAAFVLLPIFALLHKLINLRKRRFYIDYLVFSLHFHSFAFLLVLIALLFGRISEGLGTVGSALNLAVPVYGVMAFKSFDKDSWIISLLKALTVFGMYTVLLVLGTIFFLVAILFI